MSNPASELNKLRAELAATKAELAQARAVVSTSEAMISGLKLEIALLRRETYGHSAERSARLIDQLELQLEDLVTDAAEDAICAQKTTKVTAFERKKPVRKPFPEHLPRERVVVEAATCCTCCGSDRIVKMGEDITETLEVVPRQWRECPIFCVTALWSMLPKRSNDDDNFQRLIGRAAEGLRAA